MMARCEAAHQFGDEHFHTAMLGERAFKAESDFHAVRWPDGRSIFKIWRRRVNSIMRRKIFSPQLPDMPNTVMLRPQA